MNPDEELIKFLEGEIGGPLKDITHEHGFLGFHDDGVIFVGNPVNDSSSGKRVFANGREGGEEPANEMIVNMWSVCKGIRKQGNTSLR